MQTTTETPRVSKKALWTGYVLSALPVLLFLFSAVLKIMKSQQVVEGFVKMGFPERLILGIGILELACTILYVIPQTAVLGVILLTGYLGGAIVTTLRVGEPVFMPIIIGVSVWGGLYLRDTRLRALIPLRRPATAGH